LGLVPGLRWGATGGQGGGARKGGGGEKRVRNSPEPSQRSKNGEGGKAERGTGDRRKRGGCGRKSPEFLRNRCLRGPRDAAGMGRCLRKGTAGGGEPLPLQDRKGNQLECWKNNPGGTRDTREGTVGALIKRKKKVLP